MTRKKAALAIVDRSFDYSSPIGDGLLQLAELATVEGPVYVMTQARSNIKQRLTAEGRGQGVTVHSCKAYTTSASSLIKRIVEAVYFMLWTFYRLLRTRPENVYVSTNPPVVVPFIVALYCRLSGASYVYHLQDIHPEAANIIVPLNKVILRVLQVLDNFSLRSASALVTLSDDMKATIKQRSDNQTPIYLLDNPAFDVVPLDYNQRQRDVVFCGNAGRLQRIPLLMTAIRDYLQQGGKLQFTFAGGGVHAPDIQQLASAYDEVKYLGILSPTDAAELVNQHRWALLPIDDEVTRYAFPSKSSGYALSGVGVLAVCGGDTSVARWVEQHQVGKVCAPDHKALVKCFFELESSENTAFQIDDAMRQKLQVPYFSQALKNIIFNS